MNNYFKSKNYLIENSKLEHYYFYKTEEKSIYYNFYENNILIEENICLVENEALDFSTDIDKNDNIHMVYINNEGKLIYHLFKNSKWIKHTLLSLNIKSNIYNNLKLKIIKNNIHIFFSNCNLINPNIWTIQHMVSSKKGWEKRNVISFASSSLVPPYTLDCDKFGTIYLLYKNYNNKENHIYLTSTNITLNKWTKHPNKISDDNSNNSHPYIFIDSKDTAHIAWCSLSNNNFKLNYKILGTNHNKKTLIESINLPSISSNSTHPMIFEKNSKLFLVYRQNGILKYLISKDYGYNWSYEDFTINIGKANYTRICKNPENTLLKMKNAYVLYSNNIEIVSNIDFDITNDAFNSNMKNIPCVPASELNIMLNKNKSQKNFLENNVANFSHQTELDFNIKPSKHPTIEKSIANSVNMLNNIFKEYKLKKIHKETIENAMLNIYDTFIDEIEKQKSANKKYDDAIATIRTLVTQKDDLINEINTSVKSLKDDQVNIYGDIDIISSYLIEIKALIEKNNKSKILDKLFNILN